MNKQRFARLAIVISELGAIQDEEQEAFDNMPENFQEAPQGQTMQEGLEALEEAMSALEIFMG